VCSVTSLSLERKRGRLNGCRIWLQETPESDLKSHRLMRCKHFWMAILQSFGKFSLRVH
jgi:hypothetical protein